jgi:hypothetical protein
LSRPVVGRGQPGDPPLAAECHGHTPPKLGGVYLQDCLQCDGRHRHEWVECVVPSGQIAFRCVFCGGRKCDMDCIERRHHAGPHLSPEGKIRMVGK